MLELTEAEVNTRSKPLVKKLVDLFEQEFDRYWSQMESLQGYPSPHKNGAGSGPAIRQEHHDFLFRTYLDWAIAFLLREVRLGYLWRSEREAVRRRHRSEGVLMGEIVKDLSTKGRINSIHWLVDNIFVLPRLFIEYSNWVFDESLRGRFEKSLQPYPKPALRRATSDTGDTSRFQREKGGSTPTVALNSSLTT
jgi:hypothetical protein